MAGVAEGKMMTPIYSLFGEQVTPENAWREHPRPQMVRDAWRSLNGLWEYAIIPADADRPDAFDGEILVPFGPEAALSGVGRKVTEKEDIWYRRTFNVGARDSSPRKCGDGASSSRHNLPQARCWRSGDNLLEVCVWDPACTHIGTTGKQMLNPMGSFHPAESGICGSVWLETVPETHLAGWTAETDIEAGTVAFRLDVRGNLRAAAVRATVSLRGETVATAFAGGEEASPQHHPSRNHVCHGPRSAGSRRHGRRSPCRNDNVILRRSLDRRRSRPVGAGVRRL